MADDDPLIITNVQVTATCGGVHVEFDLKYPKDVYLRLLNDIPIYYKLGEQWPPAPRPHRIDWRTSTIRYIFDNQVDQVRHWEFDVPWVEGQWAIYIQLIANDTKTRPPSRMPVFAIYRRQIVVFREEWGTHLTENNPWNITGGAGHIIQVRPGRLTLVGTPPAAGNLQLTCQFQLDTGTPKTNCNMWVWAQVLHVTPSPDEGQRQLLRTGTNGSRFAAIELTGRTNFTQFNNEWYRFGHGPGFYNWNPYDIFDRGSSNAANHLSKPFPDAPCNGINITNAASSVQPDRTTMILEIGQIVALQDTAEGVAIRTKWPNTSPFNPFLPVGTEVPPFDAD